MIQQSINNCSQKDQTDWYFCHGRDELVVPQYQEPSDQYLSQEHTFQAWEDSSNGLEELPLLDYGGSTSESSPHGTDDWLEFQLDSLNSATDQITDQMSDNFFSSLLELDQPLMQNAYHPFETSTNNLMKGLRYLQVPSFPPTNVGNKFDETPTYMLSNSEQRTASKMARVCKMETSVEADVPMEEDISMEATILQDLEVAMDQLKQVTRISFRDALYCLANNSKEQQSQAQNRDYQNTERSGVTDNVPSESNTFESTIAHLMFNNLNCDI